MQKYRVAFLNTHPIQYFAPLYAYLDALEDVSILAFYLSDYSIRGSSDEAFGREVKWDIDLLVGYEPRFVKGFRRRNQMRGFLSAIAPSLFREVRDAHVDALIVHGHSPAAMLVGIAAAKMAGKPVFMRCETHLGLQRSLLKSTVRRPLMGGLYSVLDGVFAIGSANADFYRAMGVPERRIFSMPYTVDNARFTPASQISVIRRRELRSTLGVEDDRPIVLYAAKFQNRKRPDDLLRAAAKLNSEGARFYLAMIGSGEMEGDLRALALNLGIENVRFVGFVNQSKMPEMYAACDVFVLPSKDEPWGLAINEAMCAGLPIAVSREVGCVPDLIHEGRNGFTFSGGDIAGIARALRPLLSDEGLRRRMADASRAIISGWSYAECREGLMNALERTRIQGRDVRQR